MQYFPNVDVVIPCYNGSNYIDRCINSVLSQSIGVKNIIFINDGSYDNSLEVIEKKATQNPLIKVFSQANSGLSAARNLGIKNSISPFIAFLDVDDYWLPRKIENQLRRLSHPGLAVASNYWLERDSVLSKGIYASGRDKITPRDLLTFRRVIPGSGSSVLLDRLIIEECGLFDENLKYGEDLDYWIRVAKKFDWVIAEERHVVIHSNPMGLQANRVNLDSYYLRDSFVILNRYQNEISKLRFNAISKHLEFGSRRSSQWPWRQPSLILGAAYSAYLKFLRLLHSIGR